MISEIVEIANAEKKLYQEYLNAAETDSDDLLQIWDEWLKAYTDLEKRSQLCPTVLR